MCILCTGKEDGFCDKCIDEFAHGKICMKCIECGTYGFISPTEKNIERLSFFISKFGEKYQEHAVCIVPMNGCPNCAKDKEDVPPDNI